MTTAEDREEVKKMWDWNFLNVRKSTADNSTNNVSINVAFELYDVTIDRQGKLYPWALECLKLISSCDKFSLYIWTSYNHQMAKQAYDNIFAPHKIKINGINENFFINDINYSSVKPIINVNLDLNSGFSPELWYTVYNLFRISESIVCKKDTPIATSVFRGSSQYNIRPTIVSPPSPIAIPIARPLK